MPYEAVIGLEVHAELLTRSKMFCACPVVDSTTAAPNTAVCPVCAGMPGMLPVVNRQVVEFALRVALALECQIAPVSIFARKNYFYPDLPKGYQISQYEQPLALNGCLRFDTPHGPRQVRIRRVHLEEDTGKLTHVSRDGENFSLVDLNRSGVPLLEIVTEPDFHTPEEVRAYAETLRRLLRYLGVNSGDLEKGVLRIEPNVSIRPQGSTMLGTRTEVKNLNSFRALYGAVAFEIERQKIVLESGGQVVQETVGWDENAAVTFSQRSKEEAHDYRYFPEPDLPPLVVDVDHIAQVMASMPELPAARLDRFQSAYGLARTEAALLVEEKSVADYFEAVLASDPSLSSHSVLNWIQGELFGWLRSSGQSLEDALARPDMLAGLIAQVQRGVLNKNTARQVLAEMLQTGRPATEIVQVRGLVQLSDVDQIAVLVQQVLAEYPQEVAAYRAGKPGLNNWLFGQVMKRAGGQGSPQVIRAELARHLGESKAS